MQPSDVIIISEEEESQPETREQSTPGRLLSPSDRINSSSFSARRSSGGGVTGDFLLRRPHGSGTTRGVGTEPASAPSVDTREVQTTETPKKDSATNTPASSPLPLERQALGVASQAEAAFTADRHFLSGTTPHAALPSSSRESTRTAAVAAAPPPASSEASGFMMPSFHAVSPPPTATSTFPPAANPNHLPQDGKKKGRTAAPSAARREAEAPQGTPEQEPASTRRSRSPPRRTSFTRAEQTRRDAERSSPQPSPRLQREREMWEKAKEAAHQAAVQPAVDVLLHKRYGPSRVPAYVLAHRREQLQREAEEGIQRMRALHAPAGVRLLFAATASQVLQQAMEKGGVPSATCRHASRQRPPTASGGADLLQFLESLAAVEVRRRRCQARQEALRQQEERCGKLYEEARTAMARQAQRRAALWAAEEQERQAVCPFQPRTGALMAAQVQWEGQTITAQQPVRTRSSGREEEEAAQREEGAVVASKKPKSRAATVTTTFNNRQIVLEAPPPPGSPRKLHAADIAAFTQRCLLWQEGRQKRLEEKAVAMQQQETVELEWYRQQRPKPQAYRRKALNDKARSEGTDPSLYPRRRSTATNTGPLTNRLVAQRMRELRSILRHHKQLRARGNRQHSREETKAIQDRPATHLTETDAAGDPREHREGAENRSDKGSSSHRRRSSRSVQALWERVKSDLKKREAFYRQQQEVAAKREYHDPLTGSPFFHPNSLPMLWDEAQQGWMPFKALSKAQQEACQQKLKAHRLAFLLHHRRRNQKLLQRRAEERAARRLERKRQASAASTSSKMLELPDNQSGGHGDGEKDLASGNLGVVDLVDKINHNLLQSYRSKHRAEEVADWEDEEEEHDLTAMDPELSKCTFHPEITRRSRILALKHRDAQTRSLPVHERLLRLHQLRVEAAALEQEVLWSARRHHRVEPTCNAGSQEGLVRSPSRPPKDIPNAKKREGDSRAASSKRLSPDKVRHGDEATDVFYGAGVCTPAQLEAMLQRDALWQETRQQRLQRRRDEVEMLEREQCTFTPQRCIFSLAPGELRHGEGDRLPPPSRPSASLGRRSSPRRRGDAEDDPHRGEECESTTASRQPSSLTPRVVQVRKLDDLAAASEVRLLSDLMYLRSALSEEQQRLWAEEGEADLWPEDSLPHHGVSTRYPPTSLSPSPARAYGIRRRPLTPTHQQRMASIHRGGLTNSPSSGQPSPLLPQRRRRGGAASHPSQHTRERLVLPLEDAEVDVPHPLAKDPRLAKAVAALRDARQGGANNGAGGGPLLVADSNRLQEHRNTVSEQMIHAGHPVGGGGGRRHPHRLHDGATLSGEITGTTTPSQTEEEDLSSLLLGSSDLYTENHFRSSQQSWNPPHTSVANHGPSRHLRRPSGEGRAAQHPSGVLSTTTTSIGGSTSTSRLLGPAGEEPGGLTPPHSMTHPSHRQQHGASVLQSPATAMSPLPTRQPGATSPGGVVGATPVRAEEAVLALGEDERVAACRGAEGCRATRRSSGVPVSRSVSSIDPWAAFQTPTLRRSES